MKRQILTSTITAAALLSSIAAPAFAAAPDGTGPWADYVVSFDQGLRKNNTPVLANRSNPDAALGVAENNTNTGSFVSLGFGGQLTLGFLNPVKNGIAIVEATNLPYPNETALLEVSADGSTWTTAGNVTQDGRVALPDDICARYVRITDTSNKALFPTDGDGYDVDGVRSAQGEPCPTPEVPEFNALTASLTVAMAGAVIFYLKQNGLLGA